MVRHFGILGDGSGLEFGGIDDLSFPDGGVGGRIVAECALRASRGHGDVDLGQPFREVLTDAGACRVTGEVFPFMGIGEFVVEFLAAVGIADVAPAIVADRVVALVVGGDGGPFACGGRIAELWNQRVAFELADARND